MLLRLLAPALAGTALDPPELLDVDMDELAWALALVALGGLEAEAAQLAHPDPRQDPGNGRRRHLQDLGDLGAGHPQPPERCDHLDPALVGAIVDLPGRRAAVEQARRTFGDEPPDPLAGRALADFGGRGRLRQRPVLVDDPRNQQLALLQAERGVTVELHSVSSLGLSGFDTSQPPRRPG